MQKTKGGNPEAEVPPQICGLGLPPKTRVARGAALVNVNYLGGGVQGCCLGHYIVHCKCPGLVGRLLHLVMGDWYSAARIGVPTACMIGTTGRLVRYAGSTVPSTMVATSASPDKFSNGAMRFKQSRFATVA